MGIAKGEDWGAPGQLPPDAPIATSDLQLAQLVGKHDVVGVEEGDLARTLGIRKPYDRSTPKHLVPVDAIEIEVDDGSTYTAIAHVIVGHPLASAETVALMNAAFWRGRNIAPRAHPGDGRIDVVHLQLSASDRVKAWKRMATGTHVPHPGIGVRRVADGEFSLARRQPLWVDGHRVGRTARASYRIRPESVTIGVS